MGCCGGKGETPQTNVSGGCAPAPTGCCGSGKAQPAAPGAFGWFGNMVANCLSHAEKQKAAGRPIVGIMCEYTPREVIMAAGATPVCLCGGSAATIPAAEERLPANLCPLIKSTYGYHAQKSNPFLEMASLLVVETTCDGKKKMFEHLAETRQMHVLELPQKEDDPDALAHWVRELEKLRGRLETQFGVKIGDDDLRQAIATMNRERALRRELAARLRDAAPALTGRELLEFKSLISGVCADIKQYAAALEELASRPPLPDAATRVRVLLTGVPTPHGAERVVDCIESCGGLIVATDNCTGLKPILEDVDEAAPDPLRAIAEKYFRLPCPVMTPNRRRFEVLRQLAGEYRAQCVIDLAWQACLTYDVEACRLAGFVEKQLGVPYLKISTDYSPADSARIATRIEALFETVRGAKACAASGCGAAKKSCCGGS